MRYSPADALDRTARLARGVLGRARLPITSVARALTDVRVTLVADEANLASHSGQTAVVVLAQLLLASGARLRLRMPEAKLIGPQPPVKGVLLRQGLLDLAADLIPGMSATLGEASPGDLVFVFGDSRWSGDAALAWRVSGTASCGALARVNAGALRWTGSWPLGAMTSAAIAAAEPWKFAMRRIAGAFQNEIAVPELIAPTFEATVDAGRDPDRHDGVSLGILDVVSGGAITSAMIHTLLRVPNISGSIRLWERDRVDISNLNRYLLARLSQVGQPKGTLLARQCDGTLAVEVMPIMLSPNTLLTYGPLRRVVVVGTDRVRPRWLAQTTMPDWLGIGATSDFTIMVSQHLAGSGCAWCLHSQEDKAVQKIPTAAFVSYWAGLALATALLMSSSGMRVGADQEALTLWPLRLDLPTAMRRHAVAVKRECPICSGKGVAVRLST